jgi:hypothetical protein
MVPIFGWSVVNVEGLRSAWERCALWVEDGDSSRTCSAVCFVCCGWEYGICCVHFCEECWGTWTVAVLLRINCCIYKNVQYCIYCFYVEKGSWRSEGKISLYAGVNMNTDISSHIIFYYLIIFIYDCPLRAICVQYIRSCEN